MKYLNNIQNYIEIASDKCGGKPCIRGTRVAVVDVLNMLANGMSEDEILHDLPELNREQIEACLAVVSKTSVESNNLTPEKLR